MKKSGVKTESYGQYCPLALASELLCRRWTILVISRLLDGCVLFNEIHQGVPKMSPSLLSKRLTELEEAGLVERTRIAGHARYRYEPTSAARDLADIIDRLAIWGQHWARDMETVDLDPGFLAWSMHLRLDIAKMPPGRTVIQFDFTDAPTQFNRFWLMKADDKAEMCLKDPGYEPDLYVRAPLRRFVETWRGFRDLNKEIRNGTIRVSGAPDLCRAFPGWLMLSTLAPYRRKAPGRESRISTATR